MVMYALAWAWLRLRLISNEMPYLYLFLVYIRADVATETSIMHWNPLDNLNEIPLGSQIPHLGLGRYHP